ncbi:MAG: hypothetical protein Q9211_002678 [Gyalolechia sp. 1 TL-2023]
MGSRPTDLDIFLSTKFTHLVIGGGTAGLVVATRLSEHPNLVVGVLEAGNPAYDEPRINIPGRFGETLGTEYDWQFATVPQPGLNEHQSLNHSYHDDKFHGTDGPVHTAYSSLYGASHRYWHETLQKLGVSTNRSHFSGSNVGAWTSLTTVEPERRERSYSATAYYRPHSGRKNLVVLPGATAESVLLDQNNQGEWVAKGARFTRQGQSHEIHVQGEVIVCAGSVQSPQLLELSGIGNPAILKAAGVEVKVDNPAVGENLQEHMMTCMVYEIDPSIPTVEELRTDPTLAAAADEEYSTSRSGLRTTIPSSKI